MLSPACKTVLLTAALAAPTAAVAAAGPPSSPAGRGALLESGRVASLSAGQVRHVLRAGKIGDRGVKHGVDGYRLRYATIGDDGRPTTASALVVLPHGVRGALPLVAYEHGTNVARDIAPSVEADSDARVVAQLFASSGYATVAPDYLGLGAGPGHHPYLDAATEASASLDALLAARTFAKAHGRALERRVLATGFSQGGQAAMALGHALQQTGDPTLQLGALAPFSGPYDVENAELPAVLSGQLEPTFAAFNLSYALTSWQRQYPIYHSVKDVWRDARIPRLFDGLHPEEEIVAALPHRLDQVFTTTYLKELRAPSGGLLAAMRANDATCQWKPAVPVRLYAARGDEAVAFANSEHCLRDLQAADAGATITDLGNVDHFTSEHLAAPRVARYFDKLRAGVPRRASVAQGSFAERFRASQATRWPQTTPGARA